MTNRISLMDAALLRAFLLAGCNHLGAHKEEVNALNVFPVPDGDTGINMYLTVSSAAKKIEPSGADAGVDKIAADFSLGTLMGARGNSGVILSQIFRGFAASLQGKKQADAKDLAAAMKKGADLSYKSVMKPVEGTILTVYRHFASAAAEAAEAGASIDEMMSAALAAGEESLAATPDLLPVLKEAGVVDAGGKGLLVFMSGAAQAIGNGETTIILQDHSAAAAAPAPAGPAAARNDISTANIEFTFCTQLLIKGGNIPVDKIRARLAQNPPGDSLLVVGDENLVKIHFHNNMPWKVLEYCAQFGELHDIIIDNMRDQHHETMADPAPTAAPPAQPAVYPPLFAAAEGSGEPAKCGVIAVCSGDGMADIFRELGAQVINGGQTMNPSAEDLLLAIGQSPAEQVIILPNNGNIILAAQQAQTLSEKTVEIVPTKFVTEGLSAMLNFNTEQTAAENAQAMAEAAGQTVNGEVTYAVRDTKFNGFDIKQNDLLILMQDTIVGCGQDLPQITLTLAEKMAAAKEDAEIITFYYGNGLSEEEARAVADLAAERFADYEVDMYYGGQPLYYFLVALE